MQKQAFCKRWRDHVRSVPPLTSIEGDKRPEGPFAEIMQTQVNKKRCYFEVLGVEKTATPAELKARYYSLARYS